LPDTLKSLPASNSDTAIFADDGDSTAIYTPLPHPSGQWQLDFDTVLLAQRLGRSGAPGQIPALGGNAKGEQKCGGRFRLPANLVDVVRLL
jgi:hypothetical protein